MSQNLFWYNAIILVQPKGQKPFVHHFECQMTYDLSEGFPDDEFFDLVDVQVNWELEGTFGIIDFEYELIDIRQQED